MPDEEQPLIVHPGSALARVGPQGGRIVAEMVSGALALSRAAQAASMALVPRFKIGEHEFCEPDYRQILLWAESLEMTGETVLEKIMRQPKYTDPWSFHPWDPACSTKIINGRIRQVAWDMELLPLREFEWVSGLEIDSLVFVLPESYDFEAEHVNLGSLALPKLDRLVCHCLGVDSIDLSQTPLLEELGCSGGHLLELDLAFVPNLQFLSCGMNQITSLNIEATPKLEHLECGSNEISSLNVAATPKLRELNCGGNELTELDLRRCKALEIVSCQGNHLTRLLLPEWSTSLKELNCSSNSLRTLDLTTVLFLESLWCSHNPLEALDVSKMWELEHLYYDKETRLIQNPDQHF
jgi:Leucine-rich repeat (LRR) protein